MKVEFPAKKTRVPLQLGDVLQWSFRPWIVIEVDRKYSVRSIDNMSAGLFGVYNSMKELNDSWLGGRAEGAIHYPASRYKIVVEEIN